MRKKRAFFPFVFPSLSFLVLVSPSHRTPSSELKRTTGIGALGKTFSVKSPPETPVISPSSSSSSAAEVDKEHHVKNVDDDDKKAWSKVRHQWSSEGLSGSAWTAKKRGDDWNDAEMESASFDSIAEEARAAFADAGLEVLPERVSASSSSSSSSPHSSSPSLLRSLVSRVASLASSSLKPSPSLSTDIEAHGTCNGEEPRWRGAPCKGEAKVTWSVSDDDGEQKAHGSAVCDGFWSGMSWRNTEKCLGFSQIRATKGEWTMYKQCNGVEASKKGGSSSCRWGHGGREKGMSSWCHGGAAGAVVKKGQDEKGFVAPQPKMTTN